MSRRKRPLVFLQDILSSCGRIAINIWSFLYYLVAFLGHVRTKVGLERALKPVLGPQVSSFVSLYSSSFFSFS